MLEVALAVGGGVWAYVTAWYLLAVVLKRNDVADIAWGPGIALAGWIAYAAGGNHATIDLSAGATTATLALGVLVLMSVWALRLAFHIGRRTVKKREDERYARWRTTWRWFYLRSYLQVFVLQGVLMVVLAYPALHLALLTSKPPGVLAQVGFVVGALTWLVGFVLEVTADRQLASFLANPAHRGKLMTEGLYRYSRHPNYFGEVLLWWGIALMVLATPHGYLALVSPLMITFLILRVSGIPLLERHFENHPDWPAYRARTSAFVPLSPRTAQGSVARTEGDG